MSCDVTCNGMIAILSTSLSKEEKDLFDNSVAYATGLRITYNGKCIYHYTYKKLENSYYTNLIDIHSLIKNTLSFIRLLEVHNIDVKEPSIKHFSCTYYNGVDFPIDMVEVNEEGEIIL